MPSFLSIAEKAEMSQQFNNLHDTFSRDVIIFKDPERVDIISTDDYISVYRDYRQGNNFQFQSEPVSGVFSMRIKWEKADKEENKNMLETPLPGEVCRLKMKKDAFDFLKECKSFYVDGISCEKLGFEKPHGLFNVDFYTIYAKRREMQ